MRPGIPAHGAGKRTQFRAKRRVDVAVQLALAVRETLSQHGRVLRGYLGIRSQPVEIPAALQTKLGRSQPTGLLLVGVEENSPAAQGGLMVGDIITGIAGQPVTDHDDLMSRLTGDMIGKPTPVEILRGGDVRSVDIRASERT